LKPLRPRRDITLSDQSAETGIPVSTLSRLEAGLRSPTHERLLPLAQMRQLHTANDQKVVLSSAQLRPSAARA
jgi:transcriptional regulator with XRE-family HTH domain